MWNVCTYVIFCFIILLEGLLRCTVLRLRPRWPLSRREKPSAAGVTTCYFLFSKPLGHRLHHHQIYRYIYYVCVCVYILWIDVRTAGMLCAVLLPINATALWLTLIAYSYLPSFVFISLLSPFLSLGRADVKRTVRNEGQSKDLIMIRCADR